MLLRLLLLNRQPQQLPPMHRLLRLLLTHLPLLRLLHHRLTRLRLRLLLNILQLLLLLMLLVVRKSLPLTQRLIPLQ
jgi:hypothetical protein